MASPGSSGSSSDFSMLCKATGESWTGDRRGETAGFRAATARATAPLLLFPEIVMIHTSESFNTLRRRVLSPL